MSWVWDQELPPNGKIVLLAIADHADDTGRNAYPSHKTLARKTGYGERQIKKIIDALVSTGVLSVSVADLPHLRGDRKPNLYEIHMHEPVAVERGQFVTANASVELRKEVIEAFHRTCYWCGVQGGDMDPEANPWEIDRLVSGAKGGTYSRDNVVLSCRSCNRKHVRRGEIITPRVDQTGGTSDITGGTVSNDGGNSVTPEPSLEPSKEPSVIEISSDEAEAARLCTLLADRIEANGYRRPTVSRDWIRSMDRMIRIDGREPWQIERAIEWALADDFWSMNIRSPQKLREHYDRLRAQATREQRASAPRGFSAIAEFLNDREGMSL